MGQADLTLKFLPLHLGGEGHAAPEDNINLPDDDHLTGVHVALTLLGVASSSDLGKFYSPPDRSPRCGESHITSSRHRDAENDSSLSTLRIAYNGIYGLLGPYDRPGQLC
jgi:hypothetical protein